MSKSKDKASKPPLTDEQRDALLERRRRRREKRLMTKPLPQSSKTMLRCPLSGVELEGWQVVRRLWKSGHLKLSDAHGRMRWYCPCSPSVPYCERGIVQHLREVGDIGVHFAELQLRPR